MAYVLICRDRPGALHLRKENREAHLDYVRESGVVTLAGPLLDEAGEMRGSLLILDVDERGTAEAWADGDPYAKAGLFESVEISAWKKVIG